MIDPKTPLSAAAIFLGGIALIAYTTLDIHRHGAAAGLLAEPCREELP